MDGWNTVLHFSHRHRNDILFGSGDIDAAIHDACASIFMRSLQSGWHHQMSLLMALSTPVQDVS